LALSGWNGLFCRGPLSIRFIRAGAEKVNTMSTRLPYNIAAFGFASDAPDHFGVRMMSFNGNVIERTPVDYNRPPRLPWYLEPVFRELKRQNMRAQLVIVRKEGVRERADGTHLHQFLVPGDLKVPVAGVTF
jgi:hypothetical protein